MSNVSKTRLFNFTVKREIYRDYRSFNFYFGDIFSEIFQVFRRKSDYGERFIVSILGKRVYDKDILFN